MGKFNPVIDKKESYLLILRCKFVNFDHLVQFFDPSALSKQLTSQTNVFYSDLLDLFAG